MTLRKLAGDTAIYGLGYILGRVLNYLLLTVYLTWKFDGQQEQYGLHTEFYFYVAFLLVMLTLRMETTYFRFASKGDDRQAAYNQSALMLLATASIWTVFLILFRGQISAFLGYPDLIPHVMVLGLVLTCDILVAIPYAGLRLAQRPMRFAGLKIFGITANILAVMFFLEILPRLAANGESAFASFYREEDRLLYVFIANLIGSLLVLLAFSRKYLSLRFSWNQDLFKRMMVYTAPLIVVGIAGVINQSGYIVLLKGILPGSTIENLADGGVYTAAARIAVLMSLFITAFNYAAEPFFFNQASQSNAKQVYADVAKAFTVAGSILFVMILMYLDLIGLILGKTFRGALHVVPVLLLAFLLLGLYYNFSIWYKLNDKTRYGAAISIGGSVVTVILSLILIPYIGLIGSAWATLGCYGFMVCVCYILGKRHYPVPYNLPRMILIIFGALMTFAISYGLDHTFALTLPAKLATHTILALLFIVWLIRLERPLFASILSRKNVP